MQLRQLEDRVIHFMEGGEDSFQAVLDAVLTYQRQWIPGYSDFLGASDPPRGIPTDAFKHTRLVTTEAPATLTFRTSGTTQSRRGECPRVSTRANLHGALLQFRKHVWPHELPVRMLNLVPPQSLAPDSSLSHMVGHLSAQLAAGHTTYHLTPGGLDSQGVIETLQATSLPVILFSTAIALDGLLKDLPPLPLPPRSQIIHTGGTKGRHTHLAPEDLVAKACEIFSLPPTSILAEYGMTELSSQLYGTTLLVPPPWCKVTALAPHDLSPLPDGEPGLLHFIDLANLDVPCTIQTSDFGRVSQGRVELLGRAEGAELRGCSLSAEELLNTVSRRQRLT